MARSTRITVVAKAPWYDHVNDIQQRRIIHEDYHQIIHVLRRWHREHVEEHDDPDEAILVSMSAVQMPAFADWQVTFMPREELRPLWKERLANHLETAEPRSDDLLVIHVDEAYTGGSGRLKWIAFHVPKSVVLRKRRRKNPVEFRPFVGHHAWTIQDDLHAIEQMLADIQVLESTFEDLVRGITDVREEIDSAPRPILI